MRLHIKQKHIRILLSVLLLIASLSSFIFFQENNPCAGVGVKIGKESICAKVADEPNEQTKGLSGTSALNDKEGMLFIFEQNEKHGFWMKDMLIPIDIIWLDKNKTVVHIEKNISPESYPKVYYPSTESRYVLEIRSGLSDKLSLYPGYKLDW